ncbi:putative sulfate exporter family transporter, partial [Actinoplanes sp. NPDC026623]|uniref:putative sulfate exporter family transporter n=1 Tax=Actinoplanes sp. NPDC026623 TaxID=3155610 RepID=UPI0033CAC301
EVAEGLPDDVFGQRRGLHDAGKQMRLIGADLAPVVAGVSAVQRFRAPVADGGPARPPLVPLFVLGFLACAGLRSAGLVPQAALGWIGTLQVTALGAALFGMGSCVHLASLVRRSRVSIVVAAASTLFVTTVALGATLLVVNG